MKIRTIKYYIYEGFVSVLKNGIMSFASIATVASCIFILALSYCLASNIAHALSQIENAVGVSAMISDDLPPQQVNELYLLILELEHVESVTYISAEEALRNFSEQIGDTSGILAGLEEDNPLPRSFTITIRGVENQAYVIDTLEKLRDNDQGIRSVKHAKNTIDFLIAINNGVRLVSLVIVASLATLATVIITNTIRLTVNNRKSEINIMKYVGATDWFIRWPFIIEGMLIGLIGAVLPLLICYFTYDQIIVMVHSNIPVIKTVFEFQPKESVFMLIAPLATGLGVAIGTLGSFSSVRRYLHV